MADLEFRAMMDEVLKIQNQALADRLPPSTSLSPHILLLAGLAHGVLIFVMLTVISSGR